MNLRTKLAAAALIGATGIGIAACGGNNVSTGNQREHQQQAADTNTLENGQPIPHYQFSQERQALITAENVAANSTQTTSFFFQMGNPNPIDSCPSIGLGVPDSASLSNPYQAQWDGQNNGVAGVAIGQMDPDGIYVPASSTGTFVDCTNAQGQEYLVRWEGDVLTVTAHSTWNYKLHQLNTVGQPTVRINTRKAG